MKSLSDHINMHLAVENSAEQNQAEQDLQIFLETIDKDVVAGTGHRPKYLPCGYETKHPFIDEVKKEIREVITGADIVISGLALGFDTWLAQVAVEIGIPLWVYVPFKDQGHNWKPEARKEYFRLRELATRTVFTQDHYSKGCFHKRDRAMVDDAKRIVALWNPDIKKGGTYYTVRYAEKNMKPISNIGEKLLKTNND